MKHITAISLSLFLFFNAPAQDKTKNNENYFPLSSQTESGFRNFYFHSENDLKKVENHFSPNKISGPGNQQSATLLINSVSASNFCASGSMQVNFTASGTINAGNNYTLELSDPTGNWTHPVLLGTIASTAASGTFNINLPKAVPSGSAYTLRVNSSAPAATSPVSAAITINGVIGDVPNPSTYKFIGEFGDRAYFIGTNTLTWPNAQTAAQSNGANLAAVPDAATNALLTAHSSLAGTHIGYTDQITEGNFFWINGSSSAYTNWFAGEPNNSGNEDYVMTSNNGYWNDMNGTILLNSFIQLKTVSSNSPVCSGSSVMLFAPAVSNATYQWIGPNGYSSTQQNPVIANATVAYTGNYTVYITKNGCTISYSLSVIVNNSPNGNGQSSPLPISLSSGLVLHYPMNGNATDVSGNNHNGTIIGGIIPTPDRFGNAGGALLFNGSNGYIDVPDDVYFTGSNFTVSCWVNSLSYPYWSRVFDFGNGAPNSNVLLAITNGISGRPYAETFINNTSGGSVASGGPQTGTNVWTSMIYTFENGIGKIYLNGMEVASGPQTAPQNVVRTLCYIGRSNWFTDSYAWAGFDDFRIYNRAISITEINALAFEQSDVLNMIATNPTVCLNTAGTVKISGTQTNVLYQLQNASTNANVGTAQSGNGDTLSFSTGSLSANTSFQIIATAPSGCNTVIGPVTVNVLTPSNSPITTSASRCGTGSLTLSASGAPVGAVYYWYVSPVGGTPVYIGANYTTPNLFATTTYYVSIYLNGCESNRTPVTATITIATAPAVDINNGIIMRYKFDGNTADSSGRNNHATLVTNATYVNDRFAQPNKALSISGTNYLDCGTPADIAALTNQLTLSMWINQNYYAGGSVPLINDWANNGIYSGLYGYWNAQTVQQNRFIFRVDGSTFLQSSSNLPFNQWTHIACTFDGNLLKIYINGQLDTSLLNPGGIGYTGTPTQIGRQANGSGNQNYNGMMDEFYVYNRALNADEVMALFSNNSVAFSNSPVCEGGTLILSSPTIAGATYSWTGPNGFTSSVEDPAPITNVTAANAGTYSLVIVNPNGCTSSPQLNTVVINPLPAATITSSGPLAICPGGSVTLTAPAGMNYNWSEGSTSQSITVTQAGSYSVTITNANGCSSTSSLVNVSIVAPPVASITAISSTTFCQGDSVQLNAGGGSSYVWSTGASGNSITVTQAGNYYVIASNGSCEDTSAIETVYVNPLPAVNFSMGADTFFCISSPAITLPAGSPAGGTYSGPGVSGNNFNPANAGTGYISIDYTYADANGCSATASATVLVDVCTGISNGNESGTLMAYPNPVTETTIISWPAHSEIALIELYDATGRLVITKTVSGMQQTEISLSSLAAGIYQVKLSGTEVLFIRLVKN